MTGMTRKMTPAAQKASERLKRLWSLRRAEDSKRFTQMAIAQRLNWSQANVGHYLNGRMPIGWSALTKLAQDLGGEPGEIYPELAAEHGHNGIADDGRPYPALAPVQVWGNRDEIDKTDNVMVPMLSLEFAAGDGLDIDEYVKCTMPFSKHTLRTKGCPPESAYMVEIAGNSMEPRLYDGDHVVINISDKTIRDGASYAIRDSGYLRVKLLVPGPGGGLIIRSHNSEEYPDQVLSIEEVAERIEILGRVIHSESLNW